MKKRERKRVMVIGVLLLVVCIAVYLLVPYSPVKKEYWDTMEKLTEDYELSQHKITEDDLKMLPEILQKYFIKNGYVGIESASAVIFHFKDVDFSMGINKPNIKIDYTAYDFVKEPTRIALIDSKIYGIPFQGIDTCKDGKGSMKGIIAKHITLFNNSYDIMDATYLSECLMHPSLALQENITYKEIDDYTVEATIRKNGAEATGVFYFNKNYEMTSFVVEKRLSTDTNTYEKWTAIPSNYEVINGINMPTKFQAVWNYDSGDLIYFNSNGMKISYR